VVLGQEQQRCRLCSRCHQEQRQPPQQKEQQKKEQAQQQEEQQRQKEQRQPQQQKEQPQKEQAQQQEEQQRQKEQRQPQQQKEQPQEPQQQPQQQKEQGCCQRLVLGVRVGTELSVWGGVSRHVRLLEVFWKRVQCRCRWAFVLQRGKQTRLLVNLKICWLGRIPS